MTLREMRFLIISDLYRYSGTFSIRVLIQHLLRGTGSKYSLWMRVCSFLATHKWMRPAYLPARAILDRYSIKFGIEISPRAQVGPGLHITHHGGVIVNSKAVIGRNCDISHQVTIGMHDRGPRRGVPTIGDNVYIGPGAKLFGNVKVGDDVAIGANCVVNSDVPDRAVVVGVPGRVVSYNGSDGYITHTDYDRFR
jgi:serine O-acetyltransferase